MWILCTIFDASCNSVTHSDEQTRALPAGAAAAAEADGGDDDADDDDGDASGAQATLRPRLIDQVQMVLCVIAHQQPNANTHQRYASDLV